MLKYSQITAKKGQIATKMYQACSQISAQILSEYFQNTDKNWLKVFLPFSVGILWPVWACLDASGHRAGKLGQKGHGWAKSPIPWKIWCGPKERWQIFDTEHVAPGTRFWIRAQQNWVFSIPSWVQRRWVLGLYWTERSRKDWPGLDKRWFDYENAANCLHFEMSYIRHSHTWKNWWNFYTCTKDEGMFCWILIFAIFDWFIKVADVTLTWSMWNLIQLTVTEWNSLLPNYGLFWYILKDE